MRLLRGALSARVSSAQQAPAPTVASQLADLHARLTAAGCVRAADAAFVNAGYSGAPVVRPALERWRDLIAAGSLERLDVPAPERRARRDAYPVLLVNEWPRAGGEIVFVNRALGEPPEDALLGQMQGMIAEYERAKILDRSRRGKRPAAQAGAVSVL